jgi:DNA-binding PadR family transcriptional regulator
MLEDIERFSGTRLEPGPFYAALLRLERRGWIEPLPSEGRRRPYRLTLAGWQRLATRDRGTGLGGAV